MIGSTLVNTNHFKSISSRIYTNFLFFKSVAKTAWPKGLVMRNETFSTLTFKSK